MGEDKKKAEKIVLRTVRASKAFDGKYFKFRIPYEMDRDNVVVTVNGEALKNDDIGFITEYGKPKIDLILSNNKLIQDGINRIVIKEKDEHGKTVTNLVKKLIIDKSKVEVYAPYIYTKQTIGVGSMFDFPLSNLDEMKSVKYKSSNKKVVTISKLGVVEAKEEGTAKIKCIVRNKNRDIYKVVQMIKVSNKVDKVTNEDMLHTNVKSDFPIFVFTTNVKVGDVIKLDLKNIDDAVCVCKSSKENVCKVSKDGKVVAVKGKGKSTVTITIKKNGETYVYKLKVVCK